MTAVIWTGLGITAMAVLMHAAAVASRKTFDWYISGWLAACAIYAWQDVFRHINH